MKSGQSTARSLLRELFSDKLVLSLLSKFTFMSPVISVNFIIQCFYSFRHWLVGFLNKFIELNGDEHALFSLKWRYECRNNLRLQQKYILVSIRWKKKKQLSNPMAANNFSRCFCECKQEENRRKSLSNIEDPRLWEHLSTRFVLQAELCVTSSLRTGCWTSTAVIQSRETADAWTVMMLYLSMITTSWSSAGWSKTRLCLFSQ